MYINGPAGIHVYVTDEVLNNIKDESLFTLEVQNNKILMKIVYKNEIWPESTVFTCLVIDDTTTTTTSTIATVSD